MKKYLVVLIVVLLICLLGITASASDELVCYVERYSSDATTDSSSIVEAYTKAMKEIDSEQLDTKARMELIAEAYENAGWTVIIEEPIVARALDIDPETLELAYSDIDSATAEQREKIIDARETVIDQYSWQNDIEAPDCVSYVVNQNDREITFSPLFSELFPGWDAPRHVQTEEDLIDEVSNGVLLAAAALYYDGDYNVRAATNTNTLSFCSVPVDQAYRNKISTCAHRSYTNGLYHINYGYNTNAGVRLATRTRVPIGLAFVVEPGPNYTHSWVNPCVSTFDTPGTVYMRVKRELLS